MVQVIEPKGGFASRLGAGLGTGISKGLAEQVPKEIDRYRLSKGLENIRDLQQQRYVSPAESAMLLNQYGASTEQINMFVPMFQREAARQRDLQNARQTQQGRFEDVNVANATPTGSLINENNAVTEKPFSDEFTPLIKPDEQQLLIRGYEAPTESEREQMIFNEMNQNPDKYPTREEAARVVDDKIAADQRAFETRANKVKNKQQERARIFTEYQSRLTKLLQRDNLGDAWADVPGILQNRFERSLETMVANGVPEDKALQKVTGEAYDFAKQFNIFKSKQLTHMGLLANRHKTGEFSNTIKNTYKTFQKYGMGDEFQDLLMSYYDMSPTAASYFSNPDFENTALNNQIADLPEKQYVTMWTDVNDLQDLREGKSPEQIKDMRNLIDRMFTKINPEDSVARIALALNSKGYNTNTFYDLLVQMNQNGEISLSQKQLNEISRGTGKDWYNLGDMFFSSMLEEKPKKRK